VPNTQDDVENQEEGSGSWDEFGGVLKDPPEWHPAWRRREPDLGSFVERGNCRPDAKEEAQAGSPRKSQSTDAGHRDGAVRSRDEGPVMGLDRRDCGILPSMWPTEQRE